MELEHKVNEYLSKKNYTNIQQISWNQGGRLYSAKNSHNEAISIFATEIDSDDAESKNKYKKVFGFMNKHHVFKCADLKLIKSEHTTIVLVIMEEIKPFIEMILDGDYFKHKNANEKEIYLLETIVRVCEIVELIDIEKLDIKIFINNEQICVGNDGSIGLLIFDSVKTDLDLYNPLREIKMMFKQLANGLNIEPESLDKYKSIEQIIKHCQSQKDEKNMNDRYYKEKYQRYLEEAKKGNAVAQRNLGYMYEKGRGVRVDYEKALRWYEQAVKNKDTKAMNNIAHMYQMGLGVGKDINKAIEYLRKAAKKKSDVACLNLGIIYQQGKGVEKDLKMARKWYKKSAKQGNSTAKRMYKRLTAREKSL